MGDSTIRVHTAGLTDFAREVRFNADEVDEPAVARSAQPLRQCVTFGGRNASGAVHEAKTRYAQSLRQSLDNLQQFVVAARILAEAAERVAVDFQHADLRSAQAVRQVNALLGAAQRDADRVLGGGPVDGPSVEGVL